MGGFAAGIGGAGQAAAIHGQQVRSILEQRRGLIHSSLMKLAEEENDPDLKSQYIGLGSEALTGDMGKVFPKIVKTVESHLKSNTALSQAVGGPPQEAPTQPSFAGPGQTPGKTVAPVAAQPSSSPVQPQAQQAAAPMVPPVQGAAESAPQGATPQVPPIQTPTPAAAQQGLLETLPPIPSTQDIFHKWEQHPWMKTSHGAAALQPYIQSEISNNEELRRVRDTKAMELFYKHQAGRELERTPGFSDLNNPMQFGYRAEAQGLNPINMPPGSYVPNKFQSRASELDPAVRAQFGLGNFEGPVTILKSRSDGSILDIVPGNEGLVQVNNSDGTTRWEQKREGTTSMLPAVVVDQNKTKQFSDANGTPQLGSVRDIRAGKPLTPVAGALNPAFVPTVRTGETSVQTTDEFGNPVTQRIPTQSTSQKGGAASASAPPPVGGAGGSASSSLPPVRSGGGSVGQKYEKPLTPLQNLTETQKLAQYKTTINRANGILGSSHMLDSMLNAGKLELQLHDGLLASVLGRGMSLTPAEAKFAADFNSLVENVNLLRGPLGATGFRGPEAFHALQSQKGSLMKNPDLTRQVLRNFIEELQNQANPTAKKLKQEPAQGAPPANRKPLSEIFK